MQWKPQAAAGWDIGIFGAGNLSIFSGSWQTEGGSTGETYAAASSFRLLNELNLKVPNELNYTVGVDWTPSEKVTVGIGDLIGRRLYDTGRVWRRRVPATYVDAAGPHPVTADVLRVRSGSFSAMLGNAGVRVNVGRTWCRPSG